MSDAPRKSLPVIATALVVLAVTAMIALGIWQLNRKAWKEALLARYAANEKLPPVAFPSIPIGDDLLYRRTTAFCLSPTRWETLGAGSNGWRFIAHCATGAEGPGFAVETGVSHDPDAHPKWQGGEISGTITYAPTQTSLIGSLFATTPRTLMIVADKPLPGLSPSPKPDPASIPNNHLAYAVQWFLFAAIAAIIYAVALRRRGR